MGAGVQGLNDTKKKYSNFFYDLKNCGLLSEGDNNDTHQEFDSDDDLFIGKWDREEIELQQSKEQMEAEALEKLAQYNIIRNLG